jgi:hypothetical protein
MVMSERHTKRDKCARQKCRWIEGELQALRRAVWDGRARWDASPTFLRPKEEPVGVRGEEKR